MPKLTLGAADAKAVYLGVTPVKELYLGSSKVWPTTKQMGMYKTATQSITWDAQNVQITSMAAMAAYPNTVISSNKLVADESAAVTIHARIGLANNLISGDKFDISIMKNTTALATQRLPLGTKPQLVLDDVATTLAPGNTVWLRASLDCDANRTVNLGETVTYIYWD